MVKKYISLVLIVSTFLRADDCGEFIPYHEQQELEATKACSKTYNNLVVTNALRTSNLNVTSASTVTGVSTVNGTLNVNGALYVDGLDVVGGLPAFASFSNIDAVNAQGTTTPVLWTSGSGSTILASPANVGVVIDSPSNGTISVASPGTYLYNFGVVLQGAGSTDDQTAQATLSLTPYGGASEEITPVGVTTFTIPGNSDPSVIFTAAPYELTSSGLFIVPQTASSPAATLVLSLNLSDSWSMPEAGNGANAYITLIQVR